MRRLTFFLLWIAAMGIPAMADDTLTFDHIECEKERPGATSHITVQFPIGNDSPLRRAIIDYIYQNLKSGIIGVQHENGTKDRIQFPPNTCDESTFSAFLDQLTAIVCVLTSNDQQECAMSLAEDGET